MTKLWLPIPTRKLVIRENGLERTLIIPQSDDTSYDNYLAEAYEEKTRDELRKTKPKPVSKISREDIIGALKEYRDSELRRKGSGRRYY